MGKALTMQDEIAARRTEPIPKKTKSPKESKSKKSKGKGKEVDPAVIIASAVSAIPDS